MVTPDFEQELQDAVESFAGKDEESETFGEYTEEELRTLLEQNWDNFIFD